MTLWNMLRHARDLRRYLSMRRKYWMLPILIALALLGVLAVLAQGSALAPFLYTLY